MTPLARQLRIRLVLTALGFLAGGLCIGWVFGDHSESTWETAFLGGMILLAAVLVGYGVFRRNLGPLLEFHELAEHLVRAHGLAIPTSPDRDALADLGRALNHLAARLQDRIAALERERSKVAAILNTMVEGVIALDAQGRILVTNPSACRILGITDPPQEGQSLLEVIRHTDLADLVDWCRTSNGRDHYRKEIELRTPSPRTLDVSALPLPLADGLAGFVLVFHDISELRRLEQVRAEFVANVSHELRTPLTAIKGYLETLLDESPAEPSTHRQFLEVAHVHADRLGRLINDLLGLANIETGKVVLRRHPVPLNDLIREVSGIFDKEAAKKGVALVNRIESPVAVYADRDRLSQIVVNLVDNAVKYTASGGRIVFDAIEEPGAETVSLLVQDTGQGIPAADLPRITERFYRVDKARSRELGGTGLGLAIVKHLVQLHAGTLSIESELGKGTTVQITLPDARLSQPVSR